MDIKTVAVACLAGVAVIGAALLARQSWFWPKPAVLPPPASVLGPESRTAGNVTVTATPLELAVGKVPKFSVSFDTHSGDLDFDVAKVATLIDSQGASDSGAIWEGSPSGGHHRGGTLIFGKILDSGGRVTLRIDDVFGGNGVEFGWSIGRKKGGEENET